MGGLSRQSVLIQDQFSGNPQWLLFRDPIVVIETCHLDCVMDCLRDVEAHTQRGLYAAGFISYEASRAMDPAFRTRTLDEFPLIWFGLYERYETITLPDPDYDMFELGAWQSSVSLEEYCQAIAKIKQRIQCGDTYQVNYTLRLRSRFAGDPWAFFLSLHQAQRSNYCAYLNLGRYHICSVSPELFFSLENGKLTCRPMKGTVKRGFTTIEDQEREQWLFRSQKNRAENVMIVDMIRNDMGSIAETGSVSVEKLFSIEKYPTVLQMTSTVTSRVSSGIAGVIRKMFPCASITGAPKVKTMEIIKELEPDPRGIYTGSIGYIAPDARSQFNVAIRTAVIDIEKQTAEYGVGGGVVWDSVAVDEYEECKTKAAVLFQKRPEFDLIETLLWEVDRGFYLLDYHLDRLQDSAIYFQFKFSREELETKLDSLRILPLAENKKVRIILSRSGKLAVEAFPISLMSGSMVGLARKALPPQSPYLRHKTTHRKVYNDLLADQLVYQPGVVDLIFWNDAGFITEAGIANVVVAHRGELITPSLKQGLLPGVFRRRLLEEGVIKEKDISIDELLQATSIFLINSVRGWMPLDKTDQDGIWIIRGDLCYEMPNLSTDGVAA